MAALHVSDRLAAGQRSTALYRRYVDLGAGATVDKVVIYNRADTAAFKLQNLVVRVGNALPATGGPGGLLTTNILCGMFAGNVAVEFGVQVGGDLQVGVGREEQSTVCHACNPVRSGLQSPS
jgi:hypothetical protein